MHAYDLAAHAHPHRFHATGAHLERRTLRVVALTAAMMVVEIAAGMAYGSMALLADGWHMSTHAAALGLSWLAFVLARRHAADRRFVFGTWKIEILGGFASAVLLGLVGAAMVYVSVLRLLRPVEIQFNQAILVAAAGLLVNLASMLLLDGAPHGHGPGHSHAGPDASHRHGGGNLNLRAAYLHVVADALTSVFAIAALLGGKYMHWMWLDPLMGVLGAALILRWTAGLLRETGGILLDRQPGAFLEEEVRAILEADGDARVTDLHIWRVGESAHACIVALVAGQPRPPAHYRARLGQVHGLAHVTIEITPAAPASSAQGGH